MNDFWSSLRALLLLLGALTLFVPTTGLSAPAAERIDENDLLAAGFTVLAATTQTQEDWVKHLPAGKIRPMQRNGKKYFIYPDARNKQIYVAGPQQYEAYRQKHPAAQQPSQEAANRAYQAKQSKAMREASERDSSNPYLGMSWNELMGW